MEKKRNLSIDVLKAIAIISVVLYHLGNNILPYGYLAVDIFFVISGYFLMQGFNKEYQINNKYSYFSNLLKKVVRLWPIVLIASLASMIIGYFVMLPDDLENLSASVVASNVFLNNVLSCITTKNYWDIVNIYKPLMHLWYAGVLMQAYIVLPPIFLCIYRLGKSNKANVKIGLFALLAVTFLLYLLPISSTAEKFYYMPFRLFEFVAGAVIYILPSWEKMQKNIKLWVSVCAFLLLLFLNCTRNVIITPSFMLVLTVISTSILLQMLKTIQIPESFLIKCFASIGRASFSIFIWHQIVVAFMYYCFVQQLDMCSITIFVIITIALSGLSYVFLEKQIDKVKQLKGKLLLTVGCLALCVIVSVSAFGIYRNSGVVRDVCELGIEKNSVQKGMHSKYNDRVYDWDVDFAEDSRKKILVFGDSFGRDFANILSETEFSEKMQISYIYLPKPEQEIKEYFSRIEMAELIFFAPSGDFDELPEWLTEHANSDNIYVVGTKNFGTSNGIIYSRRSSSEYLESTVEIDEAFVERNIRQRQQYREKYIDLLQPVTNKNGQVRVFTDEGKFISQDCRHLTEFGAKYYADKIDFSWIVK